MPYAARSATTATAKLLVSMVAVLELQTPEICQILAELT